MTAEVPPSLADRPTGGIVYEVKTSLRAEPPWGVVENPWASANFQPTLNQGGLIVGLILTLHVDADPDAYVVDTPYCLVESVPDDYLVLRKETDGQLSG